MAHGTFGSSAPRIKRRVIRLERLFERQLD
jgi:hypothetical protein